MASVQVLTAARTLELLGETIVGANVVGDDLILTTRNGTSFNAGSVRGPSATNPTAAATAFSPASGIGATNVQAALVELAGDLTVLSNNKADKTALPKILSGTISQPSTANTKRTQVYTNIFPAGYFTTAPDVIITPNTTVPENVLYYSLRDITTRNMTVVSMRTTSSPTTFHWLAMG